MRRAIYTLAIVAACLFAATSAHAGERSRAAAYAMPYARAALFAREVEVAMTPGSEWEQWPTDTRSRWDGCRRLHTRKVRCYYEFTMTTQGFAIYNERGRVDVTRRRVQLVTHEAPPVRIRPPGYY